MPACLNAALTAVVTLGPLLGVASVSADDNNPDWPCDQALVPEVAAAVVWDGPSIDGLSDQWASDVEVAGLMQRLVARGTDPAESDRLIASLAAAQKAAERDRRLTLLFDGVLQRLNADWRLLNDGILRYSRDQERRARGGMRIWGNWWSLSPIPRRRRPSASRNDMSNSCSTSASFDHREKTMPFLCTRPRALEQRV